MERVLLRGADLNVDVPTDTCLTFFFPPEKEKKVIGEENIGLCCCHSF